MRALQKINDSLKTKQSTHSRNLISKVDASTSLIDEFCSNLSNEKCHEGIFVESCDDLIAKENDELKQEVERLMKDLARLKGKSTESNVQPSQDNCKDMVKKLSTVTCS